MKNKKFTFILLLSFVITSCGFHLRGNQDISAVLPEVQIVGVNKHSQLGRDLMTALTTAKVNVLDESDTLLNITQNHLSKRVLSIDSAGRANQYELSYQLSFFLVKKVQAENEKSKSKQQFIDLIPAQNINEKREYLFDEDFVLAKADEENRLNNDMRQAAMLQLIRRLMFSLKSKNQLDKALITK